MYKRQGPSGVTANDFQVGAGFNASNLGQIQSVVTKLPDWLTPDVKSSHTQNGENYTAADFGNVTYPTSTPLPYANMDAGVNFYHWPYSSPSGSVFSKMQIDKAANYLILKEDMNYQFYQSFAYNTGPTDGSSPPVIENVDSGINFQPYPITDAKGWCGSTMISDPTGLEQMAGQVTFDFAIDVYYGNGGPGDFFQTELIPGFVMLSFGDYVVDFTNQAGDRQYFTGSAVGNNFNPISGLRKESFKNQVSFLGAGVIPTGAWVLNDGTPDVQIVTEGTPGATWHQNAFQGKAFLFRAEADRRLEFISPDGHSDYVPTTTVDPDADGWLEVADNCTLVENSSQQDTDGDNYGNACDADLNNDNFVNSLDIGLFKTMIMASGDSAADHNGDGIVNSLDIGLFKQMFFQPPGPSGKAP